MKEIYFSQECWMTQLPLDKVQIPLIHLSIPGTHNSLSYTITPSESVSPDAPLFLQRLSHFFKPLVNPIIYKWCVTQNLDITEQLKSGIRYIDIRVVERDDEFYVAHGLYGGRLFPILEEINYFLLHHPHEVVVLDFQHFYNFTSRHHFALLDGIERIFYRRLCPPRYKYLLNVTLKTMRDKREQCIVIYRNFHEISKKFPWPSRLWPNPWPNTIKSRALFAFLNKALAERESDKALVTQCILTVDTSYVLGHPFSNLMLLAKRVNSLVFPWIKSQCSGDTGLNIVIADFVSKDEFIDVVISLNYVGEKLT